MRRSAAPAGSPDRHKVDLSKAGVKALCGDPVFDDDDGEQERSFLAPRAPHCLMWEGYPLGRGGPTRARGGLTLAYPFVTIESE